MGAGGCGLSARRGSDMQPRAGVCSKGRIVPRWLAIPPCSSRTASRPRQMAGRTAISVQLDKAAVRGLVFLATPLIAASLLALAVVSPSVGQAETLSFFGLGVNGGCEAGLCPPTGVQTDGVATTSFKVSVPSINGDQFEIWSPAVTMTSRAPCFGEIQGPFTVQYLGNSTGTSSGTDTITVDYFYNFSCALSSVDNSTLGNVGTFSPGMAQTSSETASLTLDGVTVTSGPFSGPEFPIGKSFDQTIQTGPHPVFGGIEATHFRFTIVFGAGSEIGSYFHFGSTQSPPSCIESCPFQFTYNRATIEHCIGGFITSQCTVTASSAGAAISSSSAPSTSGESIAYNASSVSLPGRGLGGSVTLTSSTFNSSGPGIMADALEQLVDVVTISFEPFNNSPGYIQLFYTLDGSTSASGSVAAPYGCVKLGINEPLFPFGCTGYFQPFVRGTFGGEFFQFTYGRPFPLWFQLESIAGTGFGAGRRTGPGSSTADFFNTATIRPFVVYDSNKQPLKGTPTITSALGVRTYSDTASPSCVLTAVLAGPPKQIQITVQDSGSGLQRVAPVAVANATLSIPSFTTGTTSPLVVTATKTDPIMGSAVTIEATDVAGNVVDCDPALVTVTGSSSGKPVSKVVTGVAQAESTVSIYNGVPGLKRLDVKVNGTTYKVSGLHDGEVRTIDVGTALRAGNHNTMVLTPRGSIGSADVLISDLAKHSAAQHGTKHVVVDQPELQELSAPLD